jgi:sodium/proline symporter
LTLFWKRFHGIPALLTIVVGLTFTIVWIVSGMDAVITSRLLTFVVAGLTAIISTFLIKKKVS